MTKPPTVYDLMVLVHSDTEADRHEEILEGIRTRITGGGGTLEIENDWGVRPTTFEIDGHTEASYHLFQFAGPPALLEDLRHSLRIADGVARHRIIKVRPGTPPPPEVRLASAGAEYE